MENDSQILQNQILGCFSLTCQHAHSFLKLLIKITGSSVALVCCTDGLRHQKSCFTQNLMENLMSFVLKIASRQQKPNDFGKTQVYVIRGLGLLRDPKQGSLVIFWCFITSLSKMIPMKSICSGNFSFITAQYAHSFFEKKNSSFSAPVCCTFRHQ